ncbi:hypothetical protein [Lacinutrix sp. Bg11-31]|uniref:hypothetical protein n=1 Tax=Lacinutrix sp. Bg11-31 TaxID=2057808 RepID=UPI000C30479C|nr:hypothetical protein [Lacinutrix sp. Bg11-31]AUC83324.1 hypothetical protein CW733_14755 [Lacinutrix sp. Bg11-31]
MKQKSPIILLLILFSSLVYSQEFPDYLVDENGFQFSCEIREIKNGKIKYYVNGNSSIITKRIVEFENGYLSDSSKVKNSLGTKILKPDLGFANVYIYNGQTTAFKVYHNGKELVKIKGNSYFLLKIKSNELHSFFSSGDDSLVEIKAETGKTYYIKGKLGEKSASNGINNYTTFSHNLILENSELSRYAVLSMKKKAKK